MRGCKAFLQEEDGMAIIEMILILVVVIGLVVVFKSKITALNTKILNKITSESNKIL